MNKLKNRSTTRYPVPNIDIISTELSLAIYIYFLYKSYVYLEADNNCYTC